MSSQNPSQDLESHGSHYRIPIKNLQSFFDPKSIKNFVNLFDNNKNGIKQLESDLNTNLSSGLPINNNDAQIRSHIYGINKLPPKNQQSFLSLCWEALHDKVLIILSISAVVSLFLGLYQTFYQPPDYDEHGNPLPNVEWVDGVAILLAVLIVVVVGALNDYNKEKQFMKLNNKKEDRKIIVFRSNEKIYISIYDLLVGDLLYLETGDVLPADCILISGECSCDESSVTGESKTITKSTIYQALDYYNDEVKSFNTDEEETPSPISNPHSLTLNLNNDAISSSSSSFQFDVGDDGILDPFLISGSKLLSGQGKALVVCVGQNSINGKLMMSLSNTDEEVTPLQNRLNILADGISKYGLLASVVLFVVLVVRFAYQLTTGEIHLTTPQILSRIINILITAITIVVVAIPEGLPLAVTLALAFATTRMTTDGNLVRVLKSCETMGGATTICSDKTGTLTINKMTVVQGLIGHQNLFNDNENSQSSVNILKKCSNLLIDNLLKNIMLNSTAFENINSEKMVDDENDGLITHSINQNHLSIWNKLFKKSKYNHLLPSSASDIDDSNNNNETINNLNDPDEFVGSKTECALLTFVKNKFSEVDNSIPKLNDYRNSFECNLVKIIPFESSLKWSGIVYHDLNQNTFTFYIKGAAEIILENCKFVADKLGNQMDLNDEELNRLRNVRESMAKDALRAVSLAHYTFNEFELSKIDWKDIQPNDLIQYPLTLDLMVGIQDPLRPGVKHAINQCHKAGVDVRMVTGDNVLTAKAISKGCGILTDETFDDPNYYMEGPQFRKLSDKERLRIAPTLHVLARSSPEDKRILVKTLKDLGEVVAVTGDGTNDAPALKLADVGFSMGLSGTEVAREASDIVLMSDDFTSIVNAIKWGRTVAASIRKFVQFQLTVNFTAVFLTFITAVGSKENKSVLTAVQLLWVNLIMDTLAALALATDKPDDDILDSKPEGRNDQMISTNMWKMILGMSSVQLFITLILNFHGAFIFFGRPDHDLKIIERISLKSMTFNTFVWMQVFTLFVSRILNEPLELNEDSTLLDRLCEKNVGFFRHLTRNFWFIGIVTLISVLQVLIMFYGGPAFSIGPQSIGMWITALLCGYSMVPFGILLRVIPDAWLIKVLPLNAFCKFISFFEWFVFGCGFFGSNEEDIHNLSFEEDDDEDARRESFNRYRQPSITAQPTAQRPHPDIIISETPSPILEGDHYGTTENHKLSRLPGVLSSTNTSTSSLPNNNTNNNNTKPHHLHEYPFNTSTGNASNLESNGISSQK